jgi:YD repeat-containing protein
MKKQLSKTLVFILLMLIYNINLTAQSNFVLGNQVEQPSTDVWNFIKYGEITPSLYTGTVNVSIPFYTYKDNDFEIPISFDYASNGNIPNTPPGILGVDWRLNAGGEISVEIRGYEDFANIQHTINDDHTSISNFYSLHKSGYMKDVLNLLIDGRFYPKCTIFGYDNITCNWGIIPIVPRPNIYYCPNKCCGNNDCYNVYDAEPDIYHFNFMGYSGTFHMSYNDKISVYNTNTNNKILKVVIQPEENNSNYPKPRTIVITTSDGYEYFFTPKEENITNSIKNILAYKLDKIIAPNKRQVTFEYKDIYFTPYYPGYTGYSTNYKLYSECFEDGITGNSENISSNAHFSPPKQSKIISSIYISGNTFIDFEYESIPIEAGTQSDSIKLSRVKVSNINQKIVKQCNFIYKQNPVGKKYAYLDTINITGEGKYSMDYHNWNSQSPSPPANDKVCYDVDHWGYYNGRGNTSAHINDISEVDTDNNESIASYYKSHTSSAKYGMLSKITYPTGGYSTFEYEMHDFSKAIKRTSANNFIPALTDSISTCGGMRIKSIKNYLSDNNLAGSKQFEYIEEYTVINNNLQRIMDSIHPITVPPSDTVTLTRSSGILLNIPRYKIRYNAKYESSLEIGLCIEEKNTRVTSSNMVTYGTTHIEYSKVVEKRNDGSKIEYNFTNSKMPSFANKPSGIDIACEGFCNLSGPDSWWFFKLYNVPDVNIKIGLRNLVNPGKSLQAERGKLYRKDIFNADSVPKLLYFEINSYDTTKYLATDGLPAYFVKEVALVPVNIENHDLLSESKIQYLGNVAVGENTSYTYNSHGQIASQTTVDSKGDTKITEFEYVTDLTNPTNIYKDMIDNNVLDYPLSEQIYIIKYGTSTKTLIGGRKYTYTQPNATYKALVRISQIEIYDHAQNAWIVDMKYQYDKYGNLLEREDRNGVKTCYVWGYNGLHPAAICENISLADAITVLGSLNYPLSDGLGDLEYLSLKSIYPNAKITKFDYKPLAGLTKITDPSGKVTTYNYNATGKLKSIIDDLNNFNSRYFYSTDNKE